MPPTIKNRQVIEAWDGFDFQLTLFDNKDGNPTLGIKVRAAGTPGQSGWKTLLITDLLFAAEVREHRDETYNDEVPR